MTFGPSDVEAELVNLDSIAKSDLPKGFRTRLQGNPQYIQGVNRLINNLGRDDVSIVDASIEALYTIADPKAIVPLLDLENSGGRFAKERDPDYDSDYCKVRRCVAHILLSNRKATIDESALLCVLEMEPEPEPVVYLYKPSAPGSDWPDAEFTCHDLHDIANDRLETQALEAEGFPLNSLLSNLRSRSAKTRIEAARRLGELAGIHTYRLIINRAFAPLVEIIELPWLKPNDDPALQAAAADTIEKLAIRAAKESSHCRSAAADALRVLKRPRAMETLRALAKDPDKEVRQRAEMALYEQKHS